MCTVNQKEVKSPKIGYKVCRITVYGGIVSFYKRTKWEKGTLTATNDSLTTVDNPDQVGFHCFKFLKDAIHFAKESRSEDGIAILKLILKETKEAKVREGTTEIEIPIKDNSPCYVAPIAVWNGKIHKRIKCNGYFANDYAPLYN